ILQRRLGGWKGTSAVATRSGTASITWSGRRNIVLRFSAVTSDRCRELLRETARAHEMIIHAGAINRDHVHMLLPIPPSLSVSRAVQYLKGRSSHKLLSEFGVLRKRYWGQHLWGRGYWVASSGNVTDDVWAEYIKNQTAPEPDDDFKVT